MVSEAALLHRSCHRHSTTQRSLRSLDLVKLQQQLSLRILCLEYGILHALAISAHHACTCSWFGLGDPIYLNVSNAALPGSCQPSRLHTEGQSQSELCHLVLLVRTIQGYAAP